ncbi:MAG TPA: hypothetical protein VHV31_08815 [Nitrolancea sp.]|jgi:hypothetical protein|nr:hypothetical protein [Nitrolancea sp.]
MTLGDIAFIAAFIVFPLVVVILSIWGLRTLNRRQHQPLARFSSNMPAETTQEFPIVEPEPPRDWAAVIQPTRGHKAEAPQPTRIDQTQPFALPNYRGRSRGVVRRVSLNPRRHKKPTLPTSQEQDDDA